MVKAKDGEIVKRIWSSQSWQALSTSTCGVFLCGVKPPPQMIRPTARPSIKHFIPLPRAGNGPGATYSAAKAGVAATGHRIGRRNCRLYNIRQAMAIAPGFMKPNDRVY